MSPSTPGRRLIRAVAVITAMCATSYAVWHAARASSCMSAGGYLDSRGCVLDYSGWEPGQPLVPAKP